jgi:hypothetical protein
MLVALHTGQRTTSKQDAITRYRDAIADGWGMFLEDVYQSCKLRWAYGIPEAGGDRARLRELCRRVPGFENHFLVQCREYLLGEMKDDNPDARLHASQRMEEIAIMV